MERSLTPSIFSPFNNILKNLVPLLEDEIILHLDSQMKSHEINQHSDENLYASFLEIKEDIQHPCESLGENEDNKRKQKSTFSAI